MRACGFGRPELDLSSRRGFASKREFHPQRMDFDLQALIWPSRRGFGVPGVNVFSRRPFYFRREFFLQAWIWPSRRGLDPPTWIDVLGVDLALQVWIWSSRRGLGPSRRGFDIPGVDLALQA